MLQGCLGWDKTREKNQGSYSATVTSDKWFILASRTQHAVNALSRCSDLTASDRLAPPAAGGPYASSLSQKLAAASDSLQSAPVDSGAVPHAVPLAPVQAASCALSLLAGTLASCCYVVHTVVLYRCTQCCYMRHRPPWSQGLNSAPGVQACSRRSYCSGARSHQRACRAPSGSSFTTCGCRHCKRRAGSRCSTSCVSSCSISPWPLQRCTHRYAPSSLCCLCRLLVGPATQGCACGNSETTGPVPLYPRCILSQQRYG
jgi:hypothetical protein